ncbi:uncharacterized protein LOC133789147 [Humulus lupulus]|uniref:uncharacterized protein LOC133789147 n=1 Tax=Humulus lupulus TaxID=3486 RepID=UPI002B406B2E|nr:uncharacterized protein LOC133789147 [Humulus lupulus]XP_062082877.1 uncharacterized protein LOC133789147 [Humulus lupulus]XP_062082878.1 uncharacterized protein LOC133789147 [Humulus lupulus]
MVESSKKQTKGLISEEEIATLLHRYSATTVLTLLHEVSNCSGFKIDWNALAEKTSTGISNANEYQMLWRHLAYRQSLLETFEDGAGAQPMDDDSDLEYELEAFPTISGEPLAEAAACVKVLIASVSSSDSIPCGSTVEAPLTINIPNGQSSRALEQSSCSMQGTNITVPVSVQKQPVPSATIADQDMNGLAGGNLQRRKRKPWSEAEDLELIAAVQKCGEGNWANILRGDFKGDRTASQLSQRWAIIRKRHGNLNLGGQSNGTQLSEAQLAARHAVSLALNMPVKSLTAGATTTNNSAVKNSINSSVGTNGTKSSLITGASETLTGVCGFLQSQKQAQENFTSKPSPAGSLGPTAKPRLPLKKPVLKSSPSSDAMVRATAVAAGARIASPSDAASLLKAAHAKNAVHIMPSGSGSIKATSGMSTLSDAHPNVHYIRTGLASAPISTYSAATPSAPSIGSVKAIPPAVQHTPTINAQSDVSSKQKNDVSYTPPVCEVPSKQAVKTEEIAMSELGPATKEQMQGDRACISSNSLGEAVKENKVTSPDSKVGVNGTSRSLVSPVNVTSSLSDQVIADIQPKNRESEKDTEMMSSVAGAGENEDGENQNMDKMEEDPSVAKANACSEKLEIVCKEAGTKS